MMSEEDIISPKDIRKYYDKKFDISIKAVYNLTYTDRYYDPKEWGSVQVTHFPDQTLKDSSTID